jgi:hypothetical protein
MIPEYEVHTFERGGYYAVEVIPNKLAVISLNTLYWYYTRIVGLTVGSGVTLPSTDAIISPNQEVSNLNGSGSTLFNLKEQHTDSVECN